RARREVGNVTCCCIPGLPNGHKCMQKSKTITAAIATFLVLLSPCAVLAAAGQAAPAQGKPILEIRRISPAGDGVEPGQQLVIQFDRKMVALGNMARDAADLPVHITPDPGCEWRWLNTSELSCRLPEQNHFAPA